MKNEKDHIVPLSTAAIALLIKLRRISTSEFVFPGQKGNAHISASTLNRVLADSMGRKDLTVHGFRATFRSWTLAEIAGLHRQGETKYPPFLAEVALAHEFDAARVASIKPGLWRAYQRDKLVEQRRPMMEDWAKFVLTPSRQDASKLAAD